MDLARKMTRAEVRELSDVEKAERKRLQRLIINKKYYDNNIEKEKERRKIYYQEHREELIEKQKEYYEEHKEEKKEYMLEYNSKYYENNKEKIKENVKEYYENNKEKVAERGRKYFKSPAGKKNYTISGWKQRGLKESPEDLDRIYELYLTQELCNACDCILTRDGMCATDPNMDHDHTTHRFRHIICRECNSNDKWMKYFC